MFDLSCLGVFSPGRLIGRVGPLIRDFDVPFCFVVIYEISCKALLLYRFKTWQLFYAIMATCHLSLLECLHHNFTVFLCPLLVGRQNS